MKEEKYEETDEQTFGRLYYMILEMYKEKFPDHDLERYVPRFRQEDGVYTSLHNKVEGRYNTGFTGCVDDKVDEIELRKTG